MRILTFFLVIFIIFSSSIYSQNSKKKKVSKVSESPNWTKEEIQLFYQSWVVEDLQFPETLKLDEVANQSIELSKKEVPHPVQKVSFQTDKKENPIWNFFSENIKLILIAIAIISFALYRLRYGSSTPNSSGKIFSKFKNK